VPEEGISIASRDSIIMQDTSKVTLSDAKGKRIKYTTTLANYGRLLTIKPSQPVTGSATLIMRPEALRSILDSSYTSLDTLTFNWANEEDYGTIGYTTKGEGNYLVQLIDKGNQVIKQVRNKPAHTFRWVAPGEYTLRKVMDRNNNQIWDGGNYTLKTGPEEIIYLKDKVNVKANWDVTDLLIP